MVSEILAFVAAPVRRGDQAVGAICLHVEGPRTWERHERDVLEDAAALLSRAHSTRES